MHLAALVGCLAAVHAEAATAIPFSARLLGSQIPYGESVRAIAAAETPDGIEIVGGVGLSNGAVRFPTPFSALQPFNNPPSASTSGGLASASYSSTLGHLEAGTYERLVGGVGAEHAALWNGTPDSSVDLHLLSGIPLTWETVATGVSATPSGYQAVGYQTSAYEERALVWTGTTTNEAQATSLHNTATMVTSQALGAYVFNGVARQVGYSTDSRGITQPRARVWSGTAASAINLTPINADGAIINAGNGDGPIEILSGMTVVRGQGYRPAVWFGLDGSYALLDTTASRPSGSVLYSSQTVGIGYLSSTSGTGSRATMWNLASHAAINLQSFLPAAYQTPVSYSTAFFIDATGNIYGQAFKDGADRGVPVVWTVPEPTCLSLFASATLLLSRRQKRAIR